MLLFIEIKYVLIRSWMSEFINISFALNGVFGQFFRISEEKR